MFRPTGTNSLYFGLLCCRISAAGWRPNGPFPRGVYAEGTDLSESQLDNVNLDRSDFRDSSFENAVLVSCALLEADLAGCTFAKSQMFRCDFSLARLDGANFRGAYLVSNRFNGASLVKASFEGVNIGDNAYYTPPSGVHIPVPPNDFSDALDVPGALIRRAGDRPSDQRARRQPAVNQGPITRRPNPLR
jgi:hypothetical protein